MDYDALVRKYMTGPLGDEIHAGLDLARSSSGDPSTLELFFHPDEGGCYYTPRSRCTPR